MSTSTLLDHNVIELVSTGETSTLKNYPTYYLQQYSTKKYFSRNKMVATTQEADKYTILINSSTKDKNLEIPGLINAAQATRGITSNPNATETSIVFVSNNKKASEAPQYLFLNACGSAPQCLAYDDTNAWQVHSVTATENSKAELQQWINYYNSDLSLRIVASETQSPGCYPKALTDRYNTAMSTATIVVQGSDATACQNAMTELKAAQANLGNSYPMREGFFRFISANPKFSKQNAIYLKDDALNWKTLDKTDLSFVFYVKKRENKWSIQNELTDGFVDKIETAETSIPTSPTFITYQEFISLGSAQWNIKADKTGPRDYHAMGHLNGAGIEGVVCFYDEGLNSPSAWYIEEVTEEEVKTAINTKEEAKSILSKENYVGAYTTADLGTLSGHLMNYSTIAATNLSLATSNLRTDILQLSGKEIQVRSGAYYRVYNTNKKGYLTNNIDKFVGNGSLDGQSLSQIWLFTETGPSSGLYKISCGTDYIASITGVAFNVQVPKVQESAAGLYKIISKGLGGFGLLQNGQAENSHFYLHSNSGNLLRWEAGASAPDGSIWSLKEVPTLNVTVPNGAGYATVSAMYPMIIPTGVEAYYAGEAVANSKLKLTKISDGVIPANQGVILYSQTAKDATASISYPFSSTEGVAGTPITNQLSNTAAGPQTGGVNDYVLYNGNQGLGFYKGRGTSQIPANKAYLSLTGGPASLLFEGDELTAIDGMFTIDKASDGKYYNLGGVEVPNPVKGCIYLHNGKAIVK